MYVISNQKEKHLILIELISLYPQFIVEYFVLIYSLICIYIYIIGENEREKKL